ncbi:MAG TPA: extracellular solute-binding protein, partial [Chloroflexota bacterium]|nr:extracellular solute-binding protein [Chloroflexota bacterium]
MPSSRLTRRHFLRASAAAGAGLAGMALASCGGAAAPSPSASKLAASAPASPPPSSAASGSLTAPADWQRQWDQIIAGAKKEGKLNLVVTTGEPFSTVYQAFTAKYGVQVDITTGNGQADIVPRIANERKSGQFLWDAMVHSPQALFNGLKPIGALDPLQPSLVLPEILDDTKWAGGFDAGWADTEKKLVYTFVSYAEWAAWINRDVIPESQLNSYEQLWDPKWRGKMAWQDPRVPSSAVAKAGAILKYKGEDKLRALLTQQAPVLTQDQRQLAEWVLRGQYPIAIGLYQPQLIPFAQQGVKFNVQPLRDADPAAATLASGTGSVVLFNRPPHPNAAKLLVNWQLSQEGQAEYSQRTRFNIRRLDVPVFDKEMLPDPARDYLNVGKEDVYPFYTQALNIAKDA